MASLEACLCLNSAKNWEFGATKFQDKLHGRVIVHCSTCNSFCDTLHGLDVMGQRLADEVRDVVKKYEGLRKISFVAHSLGGLVARYAIAQLYDKDSEAPEAAERHSNDKPGRDEIPEVPGRTSKEASNGEVPKASEIPEVSAVPDVHKTGEVSANVDEVPEVEVPQNKVPGRGTIAGLEPYNFISVATPHLGSRGHWQLPFLFGVKCFEKMAIWLAPIIASRTGGHLFLTDGRKDHPPLLRRMVTDCEDGMFMSALRSFKRHVAYANATYDHIVGRRTASIRRESEMPHKEKHVPIDPKYPHIVSVEKVIPENSDIALKSPVAETQVAPASNPIEEEMIVALTQILWERVDVCFSGFRRLFSHSVIQVKSYPFYADGEDVIEHIIDNFLV